MKHPAKYRSSERGSAGLKVLFVFLALAITANAGFNYIPVAYDGANFRSEMDGAVVKGLAAAGQMKPLEVVQASVKRAMSLNNVPEDAIVDIKPVNGVIHAHVSYTKPVNVLPFGIYKYQYTFDHTATPAGYLLKEGK